MRIGLFHNRYRRPGGEETALRHERDALRDRGHHVHVYEVRSDALTAPLRRLQAALDVGGSARVYAEVRARIDAHALEVGHVHNWFPLLTPAVFRAHRDAGVPVVQTLHNYRLGCASGTLLRDGRACDAWRSAPGPCRAAVRHGCYQGSAMRSALWRVAADATWREALEGIDLFLAPSETVAAQHAALGLPRERITVLPHGIADPLAGRAPSPPRPERGALFVGRLSREKGVDVLIEAWRGVDAPLRIVGTGPEEGSLRDQAADLPQVTFAGALPAAQVAAAMQEAALVVLPHRWLEPFGLVAVEAQAVGRPVLASDLGGPAETIAPEVTGALVPPEDPAALAEAARRLLGDATRLEALGAAARARFVRRYSLAAHGRSLERAFSRLSAAPCPA